MLSSLPEAAVRERVENVAAILRKPCRMQELLSAIEHVLSLAEGRPAD
jgi:hypothetical protein